MEIARTFKLLKGRLSHGRFLDQKQDRQCDYLVSETVPPFQGEYSEGQEKGLSWGRHWQTRQMVKIMKSLLAQAHF